MSTRRFLRRSALGVAALLAAAVVPTAVWAHCDSMDGPVVKAAERSLATGNLDYVRSWILPEYEEEVESAFRKALEARQQGGVAREVADRWFFETVVRVHRAGEGAPYTGLKPAGYEVPAPIAAADRALDTGNVGALASELSNEIAAELRRRFERAHALSRFDVADVEAGRRFVEAYVEYTHFVEALHELIHGGGHAHGHADAHATGGGASGHGAHPHAGAAGS